GSLLLVLFLLSVICYAEIAAGPTKCQYGRPCDSDRDCCWEYRCLSSGEEYTCKQDPGP
nr:RecName: Full=Putative calcium channel toxin 196; Flags: Precursor [Lychas mucronatus]